VEVFIAFIILPYYILIMKKCPKCTRILEDQKFYIKRYKNGSTGLRSYCKDCSTAERDEWRRTSPSDNERNKFYNKKHADRIRGMKLVKNYWPHLTWEQAITEWQTLFNKQNGKCALGHEAKRLHVDHCHATGRVRGLLCYNCNNGIGRLKDNVDLLQKAIIYLSEKENK
jgi:hypothetical protein